MQLTMRSPLLSRVAMSVVTIALGLGVVLNDDEEVTEGEKGVLEKRLVPNGDV